MTRYISVLILLVATQGLSSCDNSDYDSNRLIKVSDVRHDEVIKIEKIKGGPSTASIFIKGTGEIEGQATISLMMHGKPYRQEILSGKVDFIWSAEWYSDSAKIVYSANGVSSGKLLLNYQFNPLRE